jgi:hypothetical protein
LRVALDPPQRIQQLGRIDFGDWSRTERREQVGLDPTQDRRRVIHCPLRALIGVPFAGEDFKCVVGTDPLLAPFQFSFGARIATVTHALACFIAQIAGFCERPLRILTEG